MTPHSPLLNVHVELNTKESRASLGISKLPFDADDYMIQTAIETGQKTRLAIESMLRGQIATIRREEPKPVVVDASAFDPHPAFQSRVQTVPGGESAADDPRQTETVGNPSEDASSETDTLPERVALCPVRSFTAFGVTLPAPPLAWVQNNVTEVDGFVTAVNAALSSSSICCATTKRHPAALAIINACLASGQMEPMRSELTSINDLTRFEASLVCDWCGNADYDQINLMRASIGLSPLPKQEAMFEVETVAVPEPKPGEAVALTAANIVDSAQGNVDAVSTEPNPLTVETVSAHSEAADELDPLVVVDDDGNPPPEHGPELTQWHSPISGVVPEPPAWLEAPPPLTETDPPPWLVDALDNHECPEYAPDAEKPKSADIVLSSEQEAAINEIESLAGGEVLFLTGDAGTGKSVVLREALNRNPYIVLASTGLAALAVRGVTIHRFFKLGISPCQHGKLLDSYKVGILRAAKGIIIDEISMCRADVIDAMDESLRKTLNSSEPFGGIPMIFVGDLMQLAPVVSDREADVIKDAYISPWFFDAHVFNGDKRELVNARKLANLKTVRLTQNFRQSGDTAFIEALNRIRIGDATSLDVINDRAGIEAKSAPSITFTNKAAEEINNTRLALLDGDHVTHEAQIVGDESIVKNVPAPRTLNLKIGAKVMVTKNIVTDGGQMVANGTMARVVSIENKPIIELAEGDRMIVDVATWEDIDYKLNKETNRVEETIIGSMSQYPLKLAWGITAHKSQGQTLDAAYLALETVAKSHGQLYVALSRVRSIGGLFLRRKIGAKDVVVDPRVLEFLGLKPVTETVPSLDMGVLA